MLTPRLIHYLQPVASSSLFLHPGLAVLRVGHEHRLNIHWFGFSWSPVSPLPLRLACTSSLVCRIPFFHLSCSSFGWPLIRSTSLLALLLNFSVYFTTLFPSSFHPPSTYATLSLLAINWLLPFTVCLSFMTMLLYAIQRTNAIISLIMALV